MEKQKDEDKEIQNISELNNDKVDNKIDESNNNITKKSNQDDNKPHINDFIPTSKDLKSDKVQKEVDWDILSGYIEALLFDSGKPIKESDLVSYFKKFDDFKEIDKNKVRWALRKIRNGLEENKSVIQLLNPTKDFWSYQLNSNLPDEIIEKIADFLPIQLEYESAKLLTEIAYRQPVKSSELSKLMEKSVISELKVLEEEGLISLEKEKQTYICTTTDKFAELYGFDTNLRSLKLELIWRLKKRMRSETEKEKSILKKIKSDRKKYEDL
jgi:chromosome segregation and condensation protein ScpB